MLKVRWLVLFLLFGINHCLNAQQKKNSFTSIDDVISQIPDSLILSTSGIAGYIDTHFNNQTDKVAAIFIWIANNIQYDLESRFNVDFIPESSRIIDEVIISKRGNCTHYSELFKDLAGKVGVKSYVIRGYTKHGRNIEQIPHCWCAGLVDSTWVLFDPTWGAGFIQNGKFFKKKNKSYFMAKPTKLIKTHMPFDPLWQFLYYPITNQEFYEGKFFIEDNSRYFNYLDSLNYFEHQSELARLESYILRIKQNGISNYLIYREIEFLINYIIVEKYNVIANLFNDGITKLNESINIWNLYKPEKNVNKMIQLLDSSEDLLNTAKTKLTEIQNHKLTGILTVSTDQLGHSIDVAMVSLLEQRTSINRYLKSRK